MTTTKRRLISYSEAIRRGWSIGHEIPWGWEVEVEEKPGAYWIRTILPIGVRLIRHDAFVVDSER